MGDLEPVLGDEGLTLPVEPDPNASRADVQVAVRSALVLNFALVGTWAVASVVRFYLSRHLGPTVFGAYRSADAQTTAWFVLLSFGLEMYIQREIPVRPDHASDFFGGVVLLRGVLGAAVLSVLEISMHLRSVSPQTQALVMVFGVGQMVVSLNTTLSSLLHASRKVGGLAISNVASKVLWGLGITLAVVLELPLVGLATALVLSELVKAVVLLRLVKQHLDLKWRVDMGQVKAVLISSLPYYVNGVALTVYANVDVIVVSMVSNNTEVGFYSGAQNIAGLSMFISPLIGWVLMPLLARAGARSEEEMFALLRRAIELVITLIIPVVLLVGLGADFWVKRLSGADYGPSAPALRALAPMFVLTYLAILAATCLNLRDHSWTVTWVSIGSLVASTIIDTFIVPKTWAWLGAGGAGVGAAISLTLTEAIATATFLVIIGRRSFDRRSLGAIGKAIGIAGAIIVLDHVMTSMGPIRLLIDGLAFFVLAVVTRTIRAAEIQEMVGSQLRAKLAKASQP